MMRKLSIFLPHENRSVLTFKTISCYNYFLKDTGVNYEIIVGDDFSEPSEVQALESISTVKLCKVAKPHGGANIVSSYNTIRENATGDVFILTCAEVSPLNRHFIEQFQQIVEGDYIIGSCYNLDKVRTLKFLETPIEHFDRYDWHKDGEWFQHSLHNNRCLNFCTMICKSDWDKVGGFNWALVDTRGYDDNDFLQRIRDHKLIIKPVDQMATVHMNHYGGPYRNGFDDHRRF